MVSNGCTTTHLKPNATADFASGNKMGSESGGSGAAMTVFCFAQEAGSIGRAVVGLTVASAVAFGDDAREGTRTAQRRPEHFRKRGARHERATQMVYVGRSCAAANLPPLSAAPYQRPSRAVLRAAVPEAADEQLACVASRLAASSSTQQQRQLRLVFFGSSVTAGIRCTHKKERSVNFPQQLAQLLEHRYPHANVSIDVYGYPGASPSFMRACHSTLMRTDAADLYVLEMTDNLSDGYEGVGNSIEGLMGAIRQRAPAAALVLLAPLPQRCVRSLKRMKPFQHVPLDDDSTRMLLRRDCFSNRSVAASFEDVGRAHNVTTVSARFLVHEQLWRNPANAQRIIGRLHYDAVHPSGGGH